jgi:hypothetical protein
LALLIGVLAALSSALVAPGLAATAFAGAVFAATTAFAPASLRAGATGFARSDFFAACGFFAWV